MMNIKKKKGKDIKLKNSRSNFKELKLNVELENCRGVFRGVVVRLRKLVRDVMLGSESQVLCSEVNS